MQGPTIKTYFAKKMGIDPKKIVNVALTPCTAKKFEIARTEMNASAEYNDSPAMRDMDYVITTREFARWIKETDIKFSELAPSDYDNLLGRGTGAGIIFGNTGGVMEAAVRTAYFYITGKTPPKSLLNLNPVRGMDGIREANVQIGDVNVKVAVVHGTANAKELIEKLQSGELSYDFIEVMTCRGGCIGGGGQPKTTMPITDKIRNNRIAGLYLKDEQLSIRSSYENLDIISVYKDFYGEPLIDLAEKMLHTVYASKAEMLSKV